MPSPYDRAVREADYCRQNQIAESAALERIQGQIDYDFPVARSPGDLARRIWEEGE